MTDCSAVRDLLPLIFHGELGPDADAALRDHLERCEDCGQEKRFLEGLVAARPEPPEGLTRQVLDRLHGPTSPSWERMASSDSASEGDPWPSPAPRRAVGWGLSVAAMVILGLGIGLNWSIAPPMNGNGEVTLASFLMTAEDEDPDEWLVAGAPVLDALPDELLRELMVEFE